MHCWETRIRTVPVDYMIDFDMMMAIVVETAVVVVDNIVVVATVVVVVNYNQNQ